MPPTGSGLRTASSVARSTRRTSRSCSSARRPKPPPRRRGRCTVAGDILAALKPRPIHVPIVDRDLIITARPAIDWLDVFLEDRWTLLDIVPGLCDSEDEGVSAMGHVETALLDGSLSLEDFEECVYEVITAAAGRPWWTALRLLTYATDPVI